MKSDGLRSQFDLSKGWKIVDVQAREIIAADTSYDSRRMDAFVKQACRPSYLGNDFKPIPQDRHTFINALLVKHLEATDGLSALDETRQLRIAELAFIMDGLSGREYVDLGRDYRESVRHVAKEGAYIMWQRAATKTAKLIKEELENDSL